MAIIKLSAIERRRFSAFTTCLVVAVVAWVFVSLSNPIPYTIRAVVTFKNTPQRKAFRALQPDTVDVTVQGNGWQMLFSRVKDADKPITIDLQTLERKNFVVLSAQLKQINAKKEIGQDIIAINPDTLYFDFTNLSQRKVPVKLILGASYKSQYMRSGDITVKPAYVNVSGPSSVINKIEFWPTDSAILTHLSEPVSKRIKLRPVSEGNMVIVPKAVQINIPVEEFTEKSLYIPVKLINKNYDNVKVFPQKVKVTFTVTLSRYADITEDFFETAADLSLWRENGYRELPVKLTRLPPYCKIVNIQPRNVDFIVKK